VGTFTFILEEPAWMSGLHLGTVSWSNAVSIFILEMGDEDTSILKFSIKSHRIDIKSYLIVQFAEEFNTYSSYLNWAFKKIYYS
jgi:hypothetical protein